VVGDASQLFPRNHGSFRTETGLGPCQALLAARYRGTGKGSAVDVDGSFYTESELRRDRVLRCREYTGEREAQAEFERLR
jgi:hypothetical protein